MFIHTIVGTNDISEILVRLLMLIQSMNQKKTQMSDFMPLSIHIQQEFPASKYEECLMIC